MLWMIREKSNSMAFVGYEWGLMNEERRAADAVDVDLGGKTQERGLGKLSKARNETDQEAQAHGKGRNFKRQTRASQKERNAVDD